MKPQAMLPRQNVQEKKQFLRERYLKEREIALFLKNGLDKEAALTLNRYLEDREIRKTSIVKSNLNQKTLGDSSTYQTERGAINNEFTKKIQKALAVLNTDKVEDWKDEYANLEILRNRFKNKGWLSSTQLERDIAQVQSELCNKINAQVDLENKHRENLLHDVLQGRRLQVEEKLKQRDETEKETLKDKEAIQDDLAEFLKFQSLEKQRIKDKQREYRRSLDSQVKEKKLELKHKHDQEMENYRMELQTLEYEKEWLKNEIENLTS
eukprot:NODE_345_length_10548_cov_0.306728.p4 type:complete len:267 gc:universal NODE_345_length_10548_cov_0.306728:1423-623(-)